MQLHELKPIHKLKKKKRVGRGGKRGTYSGRGQKGQKSRSGKRLKPMIRELIKRYPKLRGYKFKSRIKKGTSSSQARAKIVIVNLKTLEGEFNSGERIDPKILLERKLIRRIKGVMPVIKILAKGKITKPLIFENCQVSKSAKKIIEEAGGTIKAKSVKRKT